MTAGMQEVLVTLWNGLSKEVTKVFKEFGINLGPYMYLSLHLYSAIFAKVSIEIVSLWITDPYWSWYTIWRSPRATQAVLNAFADHTSSDQMLFRSQKKCFAFCRLGHSTENACKEKLRMGHLLKLVVNVAVDSFWNIRCNLCSHFQSLKPDFGIPPAIFHFHPFSHTSSVGVLSRFLQCKSWKAETQRDVCMMFCTGPSIGIFQRKMVL